MTDRKAYFKEYYENNKEHIKEYYEKNKEQKKAYIKEWYENNKEHIKEKKKEYSKEYRENNKEKVKEYKKEYREANKEKIKEYYENNKDKIKEYREKNKEHIKEYQKEYDKEYREANKDKLKEKHKEYSKCRSCKLFSTNKKSKYLCSYCNPDKPTRQKTKEMRVKTFLEECNYDYIYNRKCNLDGSCQTYYPDFLIDCNTFFLIIECDEDAHKSYPIDCEKMRENNICYALGLPCVFLRFNPDKKKVKMKVKEQVLKSYIDYYICQESMNNEVQYLFY